MGSDNLFIHFSRTVDKQQRRGSFSKSDTGKWPMALFLLHP